MKAIISRKSEVDINGNMEICFDLYSDKGEKLYSNLTTYGMPETIENNIKQIGNNLKTQIKIMETIKIGQEIII